MSEISHLLICLVSFFLALLVALVPILCLDRRALICVRLVFLLPPVRLGSSRCFGFAVRCSCLQSLMLSIYLP